MLDGHIFFSYRSLEREFALRVASDLKNSGLRVWMDVLDAGIRVGDDWNLALQNALDSCAALIAVLSPDYVSSKYCRRELKRADSRGVPIFPILLRPLRDPTDWPFEIQEEHYLAFEGWQAEGVYEKQLDTLVEVLRRRFADQVVAIPDVEARYLLTLIAELEARQGVLEYVDLSGEAEEPRSRGPQADDEWGFGALTQPLDYADDARAPTLARVADTCDTYPRFVLLGEPGSGKTTILRKLALLAARRRQSDPRAEPLPLLAYLPEWENEPDPLSFVRERWPFRADVSSALASGEITLFLDGLNEMGAGRTEKAALLRKWLESPQAPARVVVTCRTNDYDAGNSGDRPPEGPPRLSLGLPKVVVQSLDERRIRAFSTAYLGDGAQDFIGVVLEAEEEAARPSGRSLRALASNPYLLRALTIVHDRHGELPDNVGALFRRLAQALWRREQLRDTPGWAPFEEARVAFARLAHAMIDQDTGVDVSVPFATGQLGRSDLLYAGISASFLTRRGERVRFFHQLVQEYFAAEALRSIPVSELVPLQGDRCWTADLGRTCRWDHALVAWSGLVDDPDALLQVLDWWQVAGLVGHGFLASDETCRKAGRDAIRADLGSTHHLDFMPVVNALVCLGPPVIPDVVAELARGDQTTREQAAWVVETIGHPSAVEPLLVILNDWEATAHREAALALARIGGNDALDGLARIVAGHAAPTAKAAAEEVLKSYGRSSTG